MTWESGKLKDKTSLKHTAIESIARFFLLCKTQMLSFDDESREKSMGGGGCNRH